MSFFGKLWNGIKTGAKTFLNGFTNGLGSVASSGINYLSQKEANETNEKNVSATNAANKEMVESTNAANMTMNRENIAMQQQENAITREREDNAVQRRADDMSKAGLSKTLAAGSPASANAMQAPANTMSMQSPQAQAFQKMAYKADLTALNYNINQNKQLEAQQRATDANTKYQNLVNDYFEKHGQLPPTGDSTWWITVVKELFPGLADKLSGLMSSGLNSVNGLVGSAESTISDTIDSVVEKTNLPSKEQMAVQAIRNAMSYIGEFADDTKKFAFDGAPSFENMKRCVNTLYNYAKHGVIDNNTYMELLNAIKKKYKDRYTYNW